MIVILKTCIFKLHGYYKAYIYVYFWICIYTCTPCALKYISIVYRFQQFMNIDDDDNEVYEAIILLMKCKLKMVVNKSKKNIMKQLIAYQMQWYPITR